MLKENYKYRFQIELGKRILTYTGEVVSITNGFITFKDKFGKLITYHERFIASYEEVENGQ